MFPVMACNTSSAQGASQANAGPLSTTYVLTAHSNFFLLEQRYLNLHLLKNVHEYYKTWIAFFIQHTHSELQSDFSRGWNQMRQSREWLWGSIAKSEHASYLIHDYCVFLSSYTSVNAIFFEIRDLSNK